MALLYIITPWVYLLQKTDNVHLIISQYTGWYDDSTVGGIEGSISKMITADPTFGELN